MRFATYCRDGSQGLAIEDAGGRLRGLTSDEPGYPGSLADLVGRGGADLAEAGRALRAAPELDRSAIRLLPPLPNPGKIVCVGLNYADHSAESGFDVPTYPTIFGRFASSLIGHEAAILRPRLSEQLDFEGEFVAVIGRTARGVAEADALDHVVGYSLFNDASIRDYQFKSPQWTVGKNFDGTGAFGPTLVTSDEVPRGCGGLRLTTRLNGSIVQQASTDDLVFDVASLVSLLSAAFTLHPGDVIVTGTPSGVGLARKPPLWMRAGDVCEVEVEGLGLLRNPVVDEGDRSA